MNNCNWKRITIAAAAVSLLAGQIVFAVSGQDRQKKDVPVQVVKAAEEQNGTTVRNISLEVPMAGVSLLLDRYYNTVTEDVITEQIEMQLTALVSDEPVAASAVLEDYENIGIVSVDGYLNVRETPNLNGEIIGKMTDGCAAEILEKQDGWCHIESGGISGYVAAEYILTGEAAEQRAVEEAKLRVVVATDILNVREEPDTDSPVLEQVSAEERYDVLEEQDGWIKIQIDGEEGYVAADYVEVKYALLEAVEFSPVDSESSFRNSVVNYALQFLGNPYVWGGTSLTNGADCSGYVLAVYQQFGIYLSHYSGAQANEGRAISASELRPGDLVFYGNGTINHVAMYIGNGQVVHAISESRGIGISGVYHRTPVKFVNVIGD